MVAEQRASRAVDDPIAGLAVVLQRWRLKPSRDIRWLQKLCVAFYEREPAAWGRYERVATLSTDMASFLDLSPWNVAAIRASAFLSALARIDYEPPSTPIGKRPESAQWEEKLRAWRWLQISTNVLDGLRPGYDDSQPLSRHGKEPSIEGQVLALAEEFDELTRDWQGAPKVRIPQALKALRTGGHKHDPKLIDWLWSEEGQQSCDRVLRIHPALDRLALTELRANVRLLDKGRPPQEPRRLEPKDRADKPPTAPDQIEEHHLRLTEEEERDHMTKTASEEGWSIPQREEGVSPQAADEEASLGGRITTVMREMETIKLAAAHSQEALASILPAMEELSEVVRRLQTSLQVMQTGPAAGQPDTGQPSSNGGPRLVELRVELPQGSLDATDVVDALDTMRELRDLRVQERGTSWTLLRARVDEQTDPEILEAKVTGSLSRHLAQDGDDEAIRVTLSLCE
jgi:hypothetical protein